jgi:hypothetical protein
MIIAELYGKIPSKLEDKEDILTSNVFSFFKYSNRQLLMEYIIQLGIIVSLNDSKNAEFRFWQSYDDGTEPDLIIVCGEFYILFEAKLYSDFSPKTSTVASQISREIKMGKLAAENENKEFVYVAITAEYNKDKTKYLKYENKDFNFIWTNWQTVTNFLEAHLIKNNLFQNKEFANDLYNLLIKKRLRSYIGIANVQRLQDFNDYSSIFYNLQTSKFKGEFSGFIESLAEFVKIGQFSKFYQKSFFQNIKTCKTNQPKNIFYNGN